MTGWTKVYTKQNVSLHIQNIYEEGELTQEATVKEYLTVRREGSRTVRRLLDYYNLDIIIAVGYRVKSAVATRFRQWATARLREYIVKGFTLDDERLKGGGGLADYFDELLARIREIRASEARVYQRIREIFSLVCDYREGEEETQRFFATMQNKMHYAAAGMTAAEIIRRCADAGKANMGLTAWKGGRVLKRDVGTAKNYLDEKQIDTLNRITVMFRPTSAPSGGGTSTCTTGRCSSTSSCATPNCPSSRGRERSATRNRSNGRAGRGRHESPIPTHIIKPREQVEYLPNRSCNGRPHIRQNWASRHSLTDVKTPR